MIRYHDREWGVPVHDDRKLFVRNRLRIASTICCAFMQAVGMVNDRTTGCYQRRIR